MLYTSEASPRMAEQSRACWGCGKEPPDGVKFQRCMRCAEAKLPSSYFCGEECMLANWPRHKAWHMQQKAFSKPISPSTLREERLYREHVSRIAAETGDEFLQLQIDAGLLMRSDDLSGAAKAWRKLIKMRPDEPSSYLNLATTMARANIGLESCQLYVKAMELAEIGSESWLVAAPRAFDALYGKPECQEESKPAWWTDKDLKAISARVVAEKPNDALSCIMRGHVLSSTLTGPHTAEEAKEAASWFRRAMAVAPEGAIIYGYELYADECDRQANVLALKAEAEASAARATAEAEAKMIKEAREVAEAKAAAAAQELLADEEKEKEQAAAKIKDGNAKGKGKKGKGKRS